MRLRWISLVAKKEILSTVRDRRAIVSNLLVPLLLLPAMMLGLPLLLGGLFEREQETITEVGVEGLDVLPTELRDLLAGQNLELVGSDDVRAEVRDDAFPVGLLVPDDIATVMSDRRPVQLTVVTKAGNLRSEVNASKVQSAIQSWRRSLVTADLRAAGLDPSLLEPVVVQTIDASREQELASGQLSWLIPFFIAIWTLVGGQMTAIDATAGEKERGTLEVLLVSPIRRSEAVVGKFLATLLFGLTAAVMAIVGYLVGGAILSGVFLPRLGPEASEMMDVLGGSIAIDLGTVVLLLISSLLLAAFVAGVLIAVAMFARSYKEAQSYVGPLSFLFILPAVGLQFRDLLDFGSALSWIPVLNVLVLMDDVIGGTADALQVGITWFTLIVAVALLLAFAYGNFRREGVIFRN